MRLSNLPLVKVFFWGCIISFLGSLPLGALNLLTTYIAASKGVYASFDFALGCIFSEVLFVWVLLVSLKWLSQRQKMFRLLEWITVVIILLLAVYSIRAAVNHAGFTAAMPADIKYPFISGIVISALDPMKIPFWFLWSTYLISINILKINSSQIVFYIAGIGLGSLLGFAVFIFGGNYLVNSLQSNQDLINWSVGSILTLTVLLQVYRALKHI